MRVTFVQWQPWGCKILEARHAPRGSAGKDGDLHVWLRTRVLSDACRSFAYRLEVLPPDITWVLGAPEDDRHCAWGGPGAWEGLFPSHTAVEEEGSHLGSSREPTPRLEPRL